jgi:hypothetical protein
MLRRYVTLTDKIALLKKIENQSPNTIHRQLAELNGVSKSAIARIIQQQEKLQNKWM